MLRPSSQYNLLLMQGWVKVDAWLFHSLACMLKTFIPHHYSAWPHCQPLFHAWNNYGKCRSDWRCSWVLTDSIMHTCTHRWKVKQWNRSTSTCYRRWATENWNKRSLHNPSAWSCNFSWVNISPKWTSCRGCCQFMLHMKLNNLFLIFVLSIEWS